MTGARIIAILVCIAAALLLQYGLGWNSYVAFVAGVIFYFVIRYVVWLINTGQRAVRFRDEVNKNMDETIEKVRRVERLD